MSAIVSGAVIAAGEGSRLKGFGVPKPLVPVAGIPLLEHVLSHFEAAGIASVAVIFNESERDCEAFARERFPRLVSKVLVKTTRSSLESFREILAVAPAGRLLVSTVDAFCPEKDFIRFVRRAEELPSDATVLAVTGYVHDEKPLWVTLAAGKRRGAGGSGGRSPAEPTAALTRDGRVSVVGGASGDAVTAGIYVFPERVRRLAIPGSLGRLRDFLAWLAKENEPIHAVSVEKVVDVDRPEDVSEAEELAASRRPRPSAGVK